MDTVETTGQTARGVMDIGAIMARIPHRYPMLLIDRVIDVVSGESATGIKNVTANEPYFQGHFPNQERLTLLPLPIVQHHSRRFEHKF